MANATIISNGYEVALPPDLPLAKLVIGKPVEELVALLPRIFNLCKAAQSTAVRLACGQSLSGVEQKALTDEILRDHALRLTVLLPAQLGLAPQELTPIPPQTDLDDACRAAPVLDEVRQRFAPFEASVGSTTSENTIAKRQAHWPIMQETEERFGRGPLWRVTARYVEHFSRGLPNPKFEDGWASVPAARGEYRVRAAVIDGKVTAFERCTPTDDLVRSGGVLEQSLKSLNRPELAQLLIDILDPCAPLTLREVHHA